MSLEKLLADLAARGIDLWFEGDRLRFRAPAGALTPELRSALAAARADVLTALRARAAAQTQDCPLSYGQRALWFLHQEAPASPAYNVAAAIRIESTLDQAMLRHSLQALLDRHASLRTTYPVMDGAPVQHIAGFQEVFLGVEDSSGLSEAALRARVVADYQRPFDLTHGPVYRVMLYTASAMSHVLLIAVHHIAADGWSFLQLLQELRALLTEAGGGIAAGLAKSEVQYADFCAWQSQLLASTEGARLLAYWERQLAQPRPDLELPTDRQRPARRTTRGATFSCAIDAQLAASMREFARREGVTPFVVLLAAFKTLLHRYTGAEDLIIGTPTFGRNRPEFARVMGDFINVVPLRTHLSAGASFRSLLGQLRQTVFEALDAQDCPLPVIVERLAPVRDPSRSPLFEVLFILQRFEQLKELEPLLMPQAGGESSDFGGLRVRGFELDQQEGQFDLTLQIADGAGPLAVQFKYNPDLFDRERIERMAGHFRRLLRSAIDDPAAALASLPVLDQPELETLRRYEQGDATTRWPDGLFIDHFGRLARARSERVALTLGPHKLLYGELNARANRLAHALRALGVDRGSKVALCMDRSERLLETLLGIQKSGAAYVPLDPGFPPERLQYMLTDSGASVLVTAAGAAALMQVPQQVRVLDLTQQAQELAGQPDTDAAHAVAPHDPAYVIYTSGSTGRPKGVVVSHGALWNFLNSMMREPGLSEDDVLAAVTTISFDIAGLELYLPLLVGARIELVSRQEAIDGQALAARLSSSGATVLQATPATWRLLIESGWAGAPRFRAFCGGEALPQQLAADLLDRVAELWNLYGPTETTIWSTLDRVRHSQSITVGRPIANTQVYVLAPAMERMPLGAPGEIWIGGAGVAPGYHERPELTAERFVPDPFSELGARLYRTGDLGRWAMDGRLEHLGRADTQVKVRGFRIELGEIEAVMETCAGVRQAAVVVRSAAGGDERLVGCLVLQSADNQVLTAVRKRMVEALPDYMVPRELVCLDSLPLTANGKVDRNTLSRMPLEARAPVRAAPTAMSHSQQRVAELWKQVLQTPHVGANDNFFDLGGHSLLLTRLQAAIKREFGTELPLVALFQYTTVAAQAEQLAPQPVTPRENPALLRARARAARQKNA